MAKTPQTVTGVPVKDELRALRGDIIARLSASQSGGFATAAELKKAFGTSDAAIAQMKRAAP